MAEVKAFVDGKIAGKKVVVFAKGGCPYCTMAKQALSGAPVDKDDIDWIDIARDPRCSKIQDYLNKITGGRSVPRVFIKGKCIGGGTETADAAKSGKLAVMLKD